MGTSFLISWGFFYIREVEQLREKTKFLGKIGEHLSQQLEFLPMKMALHCISYFSYIFKSSMCKQHSVLNYVAQKYCSLVIETEITS